MRRDASPSILARRAALRHQRLDFPTGQAQAPQEQSTPLQTRQTELAKSSRAIPHTWHFDLRPGLKSSGVEITPAGLMPIPARYRSWAAITP